MRKLFHNCKGAVTVMVTLLLIPAILVSGTGVDLARVYSAKSVLQDANQLAANSVLASYEALLQDLYGLYGVMSGGDLGTDGYIKQAVQGGDWDRGLGTFQAFYGSNLSPCVLTPAPGQNLGNTAVLRRQIEEYAKLRAPAIIAELLMEKLDVFEKIQEDAKIIKKKLEVDDGVEELEKYYRKIYNHIKSLEDCAARETAMTGDASAAAAEIQRLLGNMQEIKDEYFEKKAEHSRQISLSNDPDPVIAAEALARARELEKDMERLEMEYEGYWTLLQRESKRFSDNKNKYIRELDRCIGELGALLDECEKAEKAKEELRAKLGGLKESLDSGKCSNTLKEGLTEPEEDSGDGRSVLDRYDALLEYDIEGMGQAMYDHDRPQLEQTREILREARLAGILLNEYRQVNMETFFPLKSTWDIFSEAMSDSTEFKPHVMPNGKGYLRFSELRSDSRAFWEELVAIYDAEKGKGAEKKKLESAVTTIFQKAQEIFKDGLLNFQPEGADRLINGTDDSSEDSGSKFGTGEDWRNKDEGRKEMEDSLDGDFLSKLAGTAGAAGDKLLLLVYDTEMFSDYSTPTEDSGGYPEKNMAGIPLSVDVNYFFQSELEYLYNGNLTSAEDNLKSVAGMLLLVRFVMNYVASFSIPEVNGIVNGVKSALAWTGPFAILAGELARLSLSIGEAAIDVSRLRNGDEVAVFKTGKTWKLSIKGLVESSTGGLSKEAVEKDFSDAAGGGSDSREDGREKDEGVTMGYTDYMRLFLLLVPGDTLANRTRTLIELNVTNNKNKLYAEEEEMASAERYRLSKLFTGFSLTTTVDVKLLFLSMPFAQKGVDGVIPPGTMTLSATDYRGY